jgi:predicted transposase/invertase (TIGR01784 family)
MILGIDPKVDYAFKRLFGREQNVASLISLLNAVLELPPDSRIVAVEILNPFQEKELETDKLSILDIKARDSTGRQFNVEMQLLVFGAFRPRVLYYWAKLHQSQLTAGADYRLLRPTVTIVFVNESLFPALSSWHSVFELRERQTGVVFSEQMQMHLLEIPKFKMAHDELRTPLEGWVYFLKHGAELDPEQLPLALHRPDYQQALEEMKMMTKDELERDIYENRLKAQRDFAAATEEAEERGRNEGRNEGLAVGVLIGRIQYCQQLLRQPITSTQHPALGRAGTTRSGSGGRAGAKFESGSLNRT